MATSDLWFFLHSKLTQQTPVALLTVLSCDGSTPAKAGANMALSLDQDSVGTIGGGAVEYLLRKETYELLKCSQQAIHHRSIDSHSIGMLCGGAQDIAIVLLNQQSLQLIEQVLACLQHKQCGILTINAREILFKQNETAQSCYFHSQKDWCYQQNIGELSRAFIVGGGHVSLALSQFLKPLDFHVTVIDSRPGLKLLEDNSAADSKLFIDSYQDIAAYIPGSSQHYVIIMTHTHAADQQVLEILLHKKFAYLGMIGSQHKIEVLFSRLRAKGISEQQLQSVSAPIGLKIPCHSVQEIAISIAAQLIECKNAVKPASHH